MNEEKIISIKVTDLEEIKAMMESLQICFDALLKTNNVIDEEDED